MPLYGRLAEEQLSSPTMGPDRTTQLMQLYGNAGDVSRNLLANAGANSAASIGRQYDHAAQAIKGGVDSYFEGKNKAWDEAKENQAYAQNERRGKMSEMELENAQRQKEFMEGLDPETKKERWERLAEENYGRDLKRGGKEDQLLDLQIANAGAGLANTKQQGVLQGVQIGNLTDERKIKYATASMVDAINNGNEAGGRAQLKAQGLTDDQIAMATQGAKSAIAGGQAAGDLTKQNRPTFQKMMDDIAPIETNIDAFAELQSAQKDWQQHGHGKALTSTEATAAKNRAIKALYAMGKPELAQRIESGREVFDWRGINAVLNQAIADEKGSLGRQIAVAKRAHQKEAKEPEFTSMEQRFAALGGSNVFTGAPNGQSNPNAGLLQPGAPAPGPMTVGAPGQSAPPQPGAPAPTLRNRAIP